MITVRIGNIFESSASTLVNTVNCVGVMGKGIALEFKKRYPDMFREYASKCSDGMVRPGLPYLYQDLWGTSILNFPTKDHWRGSSRLSYVIDGLKWFIQNYEELNITSIAFPPLGCGNGGLEWSQVGPIMYDMLRNLPIDIEIYAPYGTSVEMISTAYLESALRYPSEDITGNKNIIFNKYWLLIVYVIDKLNHDSYSLDVGRTIFQKICYILTRTGIPTGFVFRNNLYGPYSPDVNNAMKALANSNYITEETLGRMVRTVVAPDFSLSSGMFTSDEMEKAELTYDLMSRIHSTDQAEILTTVLFSYDELKEQKTGAVLMSEILQHVFTWKKHWNPEKRDIIVDTMYDLTSLKWMSPVPDIPAIDL